MGRLRRLYWDIKIMGYLRKGDSITLSAEESWHGAKVLRFKKGGRFILQCPGGEAEAEVEEIEKEGQHTYLTLRLLEDLKHDWEKKIQKAPPRKTDPSEFPSLEESEKSLAEDKEHFESFRLPKGIRPEDTPFPVVALGLLKRPKAFETAV